MSGPTLDRTALALVRSRLDAMDRRARLLLVIAQRADLELQDPSWAGQKVPGWASWSEVSAMCEESLADVKRKRRLLERLEAGALMMGSTEILDWLLEA